MEQHQAQRAREVRRARAGRAGARAAKAAGAPLLIALPDRLRAAAPDADVVVRAPGRANLIGEHTDYNEGFVLPVALEVAAYVAGRRGGQLLKLRSLEEEGEVVVDLRTGAGPQQGWRRYATAVVRALLDDSVALTGLDVVLHSEVPVGAGLSSSAAIEVALAIALASEPLDPVRIARICRRAENDYVGVETGIMDQLASAAGRAGHALLVDCRSSEVTPVPVPDHVTVLVVDSTVRRTLDAGAYNERRAQCREACKALGVTSLRDANLKLLGRRDLDEVLFRRARHVITENQRVLEAAAALRGQELTRIGELFAASHRSLAEDYEVSTPELDALVEAARATPGVHGARLTGAGFGGCTVNLVDARAAEHIAREVTERYARATGNRARVWLSRPAEGASRAR